MAPWVEKLRIMVATVAIDLHDLFLQPRWDSNLAGVLEFVERLHISAPGSIERIFQCRLTGLEYSSTTSKRTNTLQRDISAKRKEGLDRDIYYLVLHSIHSK